MSSLNSSPHKFEDRVVVVTGSTRGVGRAIAEAFAHAGAHVVINSSSSEQVIESVLQNLPGGGERHLGIRADVSSVRVSEMAAQVEKRFGRCDVLVNNAGFTRFIPHAQLGELTEEIFDRTLAVKLKGPFLCVKAFAPLLRRYPPGLVVNIASIAATTAMGSSIAYCASKAGLVNMTRSLARALAPEIRVNSISPGLMDTELTRNWDEYRQEQINQTPMGRLGSPEDVAKCVLAIAVDMDYVTGADFVIDGGRVLSQ